MRRSVMIGSFLAGAVALAGRLFGFHPEEMPVLIKTDPKPWLPTGSKSKPAKKRIAMWLGFRFHLGTEPPGADGMPGWSRTVCSFRFGLLDRLRLLWSGALDVHITNYSDAPVKTVVTRMDHHIRFDGRFN